MADPSIKAYSLSLYFKNGGGSCYVISVGNYETMPDKQHFSDGLNRLAQEDEPTLIVLTDAVRLNADDYYALCQDALTQCHTLGDRFAILDVLDGAVADFRNKVTSSYLRYGAAYHPYLQTTLNDYYTENQVAVRFDDLTRQNTYGEANGIQVTYTGSLDKTPTVTIIPGTDADAALTFSVMGQALTISNVKGKTGANVETAWNTWVEASADNAGGFSIAQANNGLGDMSEIEKSKDPLPPTPRQNTYGAANGIQVTYTGSSDDTPTVTITPGTDADAALTFSVMGQALTIENVKGKTGEDVETKWNIWAGANNANGFNIKKDGDGSSHMSEIVKAEDPLPPTTLDAIKDAYTEHYNAVKASLARERVTLPPSAAIAGIYAQVDRDRGVWKAPANVSLASVIGPVTKITHAEQESLNVDSNSGKSINAIRDFTGKGTLVWGARTLDGNSNEWRYVSVRRLFNTIEESTRKATAFAVFEPNDATTWLKVKAMIESYLYGLWEQGALAGSTPEAAYFVNVGLGTTMTSQDVLEGRMIVEIGIAAVRPAEFVILRFSHKLQEA